MTHRWRKHDRRLVGGDILRRRLSAGKYSYAVCVGQGFGCAPPAPPFWGNAIYVSFESANLKEVLAHRGDALGTDAPDEARWDRSWGIQYLT